MRTYTDFDIAEYKTALAHYAVKEKNLVDKWAKYLEKLDSLYRTTPADYPSAMVHQELERLSELQRLCAEFLIDLKAPADMFLTDIEMRGCK